MPAYVIGGICTLCVAFSSDRFKERGFHFAIPTMLACLGYLLLIITRESSTIVRYICLTIAVSGNFASVPPMVTKQIEAQRWSGETRLL